MPKRKIITGWWSAVALALAALAIACTGAEPREAPVIEATPGGEPTLTETATPTLPAEASPAPIGLRPAQEVVFIEEPDFDKVLGMIEAGEVHLYASGTSDPDRERRIQDSTVMDHDISYGSYTELTFNPVGPTFPETGDLNPFHVPAIREAMNWLVDRNHIVEEIYGGLGFPAC